MPKHIVPAKPKKPIPKRPPVRKPKIHPHCEEHNDCRRSSCQK
jgi:hypothetical protein